MDLNSFVFPTSAGKEVNPENFRNRVLAASVKRANKNLARAKLAPLPERLTPHSMRRTFASVLYALGEDPGVVMDEMGHTDPGLALRVYRQSMRRDDNEKTALKRLVEGKTQRRQKTRRETAAMGSGEENGAARGP
jgi:integrase